MTSVDPTLRNELLFREVNEHIVAIAATADASQQVEVLCECGDEACIATIVMRLGEYTRLREHTSRFVVCDGHEQSCVDRVVERTPEYLVVEKVGKARAEAEAWHRGLHRGLHPVD
jgi:hypothetical protein